MDPYSNHQNLADESHGLIENLQNDKKNQNTVGNHSHILNKSDIPQKNGIKVNFTAKDHKSNNYSPNNGHRFHFRNPFKKRILRRPTTQLKRTLQHNAKYQPVQNSKVIIHHKTTLPTIERKKIPHKYCYSLPSLHSSYFVNNTHIPSFDNFGGSFYLPIREEKTRNFAASLDFLRLALLKILGFCIPYCQNLYEEKLESVSSSSSEESFIQTKPEKGKTGDQQVEADDDESSIDITKPPKDTCFDVRDKALCLSIFAIVCILLQLPIFVYKVGIHNTNTVNSSLNLSTINNISFSNYSIPINVSTHHFLAFQNQTKNFLPHNNNVSFSSAFNLTKFLNAEST